MYNQEIAPAPYEEDNRIVKKGFQVSLHNTFYYPLVSLKKKGLLIMHPQEGMIYTAEPMGDMEYNFQSYQKYLKLKKTLKRNSFVTILGSSVSKYSAKVKQSCPISKFQTLGYFFEKGTLQEN